MANKEISSKDPKTIYAQDDRYPDGFVEHPMIIMDPEGDDPENGAPSKTLESPGTKPYRTA